MRDWEEKVYNTHRVCLKCQSTKKHSFKVYLKASSHSKQQWFLSHSILSFSLIEKRALKLCLFYLNVYFYCCSYRIGPVCLTASRWPHLDDSKVEWTFRSGKHILARISMQNDMNSQIMKVLNEEWKSDLGENKSTSAILNACERFNYSVSYWQYGHLIHFWMDLTGQDHRGANPKTNRFLHSTI
jgi:hypothetical protein